MSKFDLPICKVAMHFPLDNSSSPYVVDYSSIDITGKSTELRRLKYKIRALPNVKKNVPSLKLLACMTIYKL